MNNSAQNVWNAIFNEKNALALTLSAALIIVTVIGGNYYSNKKNVTNTLTVTGSARTEVVSDTVVWRAAITRSVSFAGLKDGYTQMAKDLEIVKKFLTDNNISAESITVQPIAMNEDWNNSGPVAQEFKRYTLNQSIEIKTADVQGVTALAQRVGEIINSGVLFQSYGLEYYYTNLADMRVEMLADAVADAKARAKSMAGAGGQRVGSLQSASSGVVQVLSRGSVEVSDYGSYDTSKIEKEVMVTVRATFGVR
jgi:uncharacterized protein